MAKSLTMIDVHRMDINTVLADMGKTVVIDGYIYRKVQIVSQHSGIFTPGGQTVIFTPGGQTGYICLNNNYSPLLNNEYQNIYKLN